MISPVFWALRNQYPDASLDFLTLAGNREALEAINMTDEITVIDTSTFFSFLYSWWQAVRRLRDKKYDIIIDFEQFARFSAILCHQFGGRFVIGFSTRGQYRHYLQGVSVPYNNTLHTTRSFFSLAEAAGVSDPYAPCDNIPTAHVLRERGEAIARQVGITDGEIIVLMHIGTSENFMERRWLPERYAMLADKLSTDLGARTILTGLPDETDLILDVIKSLRFPQYSINLGGKLSFRDFFSLIAASDLVVSADTSSVHLASVLDVPVVGIYGPNTPVLYGPWGKRGLAIYRQFECSPCITNFNAKIHTCLHSDGRGACMRAVDVETMYAAIADRFLLPEAADRLERLRKEHV